jgi:hypothetical protein
MEIPYVEDYMDSTCVASTGGEGGFINMAF